MLGTAGENVRRKSAREGQKILILEEGVNFFRREMQNCVITV